MTKLTATSQYMIVALLDGRLVGSQMAKSEQEAELVYGELVEAHPGAKVTARELTRRAV